MPKAAKLLEMARKAGFVCFIDTDGRVKVYPDNTAKKRPGLVKLLVLNYGEIHAQLFNELCENNSTQTY